MYEVSVEVMTLNEKFKKTQTNFADVVNAILLDPKKKIKASEAGDGCCEGGETPEA